MYLAGKQAYLSGPIEFDEPINWRDEPMRFMHEELGIRPFDPNSDPKQDLWPKLNKAREEKDFDQIQAIGRRFVRKDLGTIDRSDFVVAYLPYKVPTCGTHHEIINSHNAQKPTLLVCPHGKEYVAPWYYGFIPHKYFFGSWDALFEYLREVDRGDHQGDWLWALVYGVV